VLRVECTRCDHKGRYSVAKLIEKPRGHASGLFLRLADSTLARADPIFLGMLRHIRGQNRVTKHLLDENDVLLLLNEVVDRAGGQAAWARQSGIDRTLLNQVLRGKRRLTPTIIQARANQLASKGK
jgi:hypothetical protein